MTFIANRLAEYAEDLESEYARLSRDEELALCAQMKAGDSAARERLIKSVLPWAMRLATKQWQAGFAPEDLVQIANLGVVRAMRTYDATQSRLTSYVARVVQWEVRQHIERHAGVVLQPTHFNERKAGREPRKLKYASTEVMRETGDDIAASEHDYAETLNEKQRSTRLRAAIDQLPSREREVLERRFDHDETLKEIGERLGVCKERVRQLEVAAIERLREMLVA